MSAKKQEIRALLATADSLRRRIQRLDRSDPESREAAFIMGEQLDACERHAFELETAWS